MANNASNLMTNNSQQNHNSCGSYMHIFLAKGRILFLTWATFMNHQKPVTKEWEYA